MRKRQHDVKFIIYQALYLIVISLITLKGADLDLARVESAAVSDSLKTDLELKRKYTDSLAAEFARQVELQRQQEELQRQIEAQMRARMEKLKSEATDEAPLAVSIGYIQYTWNMARNSGKGPVEIYDPENRSRPLAIIKPGEEKKFDLEGQTEIIVKFGTKEQKIPVLKNKPPIIRIEKITTKMEGSKIYLYELQQISCFRVFIEDERTDQLNISFSGPITATGPKNDSRGNLIYFVSPNLARNEDALDDWTDKHGDAREADGRYKVNFFINITDARTKEKFSPTGSAFYFTDYKK